MRTKIFKGLLWALAQLGYMMIILAVMAVGWGVAVSGLWILGVL